MEDAPHGINLLLGCIFIVRSTQLLGLSYPIVSKIVIYRNYKKANTDNITFRRWYLVIEEFESREHLVQFLFYNIFFFRRIVYVAVLIGLKGYGNFQIGFNIPHCVLVLVYVVICRPFYWKSDEILSIIVECINCVCFVLLIFYQTDIDKYLLKE